MNEDLNLFTLCIRGTDIKLRKQKFQKRRRCKENTETKLEKIFWGSNHVLLEEK